MIWGQITAEAISDSIDLDNGRFFSWGDFWLLPLETENGKEMIGMIGVSKNEDVPLDQLSAVGLNMLTLRAEIALEDRRLQRQVLDVTGRTQLRKWICCNACGPRSGLTRARL